jgi:hypothetical protein
VSDWYISGDGQIQSLVGDSAGAPGGTAVAGSGIAHTKGSWVSVGTGGDESGLLVVNCYGASAWTAPGSPPSQTISLLDIGVDGATTTAIISNLLVYHPSALVGQGAVSSFALPVNVPTGSAFYARCQSADGNPVSLKVSVGLVHCGWGASAGNQRVESLGVSTGSSDGTNVVPGAAPTYGAYAQLTGATAGRSDWLVLAVGCPGSFPSAGTTHNYLIQVGLGAAASEVVFATIPVTVNSLGQVTQAYTPPMPASIPAGTRVAVRATTSTGGPNLTVAAYLAG